MKAAFQQGLARPLEEPYMLSDALPRVTRAPQVDELRSRLAWSFLAL